MGSVTHITCFFISLDLSVSSPVMRGSPRVMVNIAEDGSDRDCIHWAGLGTRQVTASQTAWFLSI